jgi:methylglyoxal/glyoxal reductase
LAAEAFMDLSSTVTLNNGVVIPLFGLGTYRSAAGTETRSAVRWALEAGYRHVDTAAFYGNEADVAAAVRESGLSRESVFVTTKLWNSDQGYASTLKAFDASRSRLGMDVIDLYLLHWPVKGLFTDSWKALEKLYAEKKVRAIGVSNFLIHHLEELARSSPLIPAVNQVEFHPFLVQKELLAYDQRKGIRHEAWAPLTRSRGFQNPVVAALARKYAKTPAQIILRWDIQLGVVTIPKSVHRERILENCRVFDFTLEGADMDSITALDEDKRIGPHPDTITA